MARSDAFTLRNGFDFRVHYFTEIPNRSQLEERPGFQKPRPTVSSVIGYWLCVILAFYVLFVHYWGLTLAHTPFHYSRTLLGVGSHGFKVHSNGFTS